MMTNLETFTEKLLQIVLVGQPELEQKLKQPNLRQLRQRLTLRAKTYPLTVEETKSYVAQRLRIAGWDGQTIFDSESLLAIHQYACGIPRVVNLVCEHCLVSAFVDQQRIVTANVVEVVARDFDLVENPFSGVPRSQFQPSSSGKTASNGTPPAHIAADTALAATSPSSYQREAAYPAGDLETASTSGSPVSSPVSSGPRIVPPAAVRAFSEQNPVSPSSVPPVAQDSLSEKFNLVDALKTLANLADRLRESEQDVPKERKL
jgi:hypothetical protein